MEGITAFTSKQRTKNRLQRFIDAKEDLKKVQQFNSDLNDTLLQVHMKLMLDVDSGMKSLQWAQKERHDELLNELGQLRSLVGRANQPVALHHSKSTVEIMKRQNGKEKTEPELPAEKWPWKGKARDQFVFM